jgi:hypothetical protein
VKGTLTNYRYDLTLELTPDERFLLLALLRTGISHTSSAKEIALAQELLAILNVRP